MRIYRFQDNVGRVRYGTDLHDDGTIQLLEGAKLGSLEPSSERVRVRKLLAPLRPSNLFCIGLNYRRHAEETGADLPERPVVFMKPSSAVTHPDDPIRLPRCSSRPEVDYEAELAVVIGREARDVTEARALDFVLGYTCANDVSARWWQKHGGGGQWIRGKGFDTFCPLGPCIVTHGEGDHAISDPQALTLRTTVQGETLQQSTTADMIFSVAQIVAFLSQDTTLAPGTVILTGTPSGVGVARDPQRFLQAGDRVVVEIQGIGRLENPVEAARA